MNIYFSIDDRIPAALNEDAQEFVRDMRFLSALMWYRRNKLSLGKAAELAGLSKLDFIDRMRIEGEPILDYSEGQMSEVAADASKLP